MFKAFHFTGSGVYYRATKVGVRGERQTDKQKDRQIERQTDLYIGREKGRERFTVYRAFGIYRCMT